jgi:hypothetical protein
MKLITRSSDKLYIAEKSTFLRSKGILTSLSGENAAQIGYPANSELGLWVVINEQYEDAIACLNNENHEVKNPLSPEQMLELEVATANSLRAAIDSFGSKLALFLVVAFIVGFLVYAFASGT